MGKKFKRGVGLELLATIKRSELTQQNHQIHKPSAKRA